MHLTHFSNIKLWNWLHNTELQLLPNYRVVLLQDIRHLTETSQQASQSLLAEFVVVGEETAWLLPWQVYFIVTVLERDAVLKLLVN